MWIQFLLIAAVVLLGSFFMRRTGADSHLALRRIGFLFFIIAAVMAILFPQLLTWLANLIGVGRGTDLLLYALIIVFLVFVFTQFRRNNALQRQLTILSRRIAILDAREEERAAAVAPEADDGRDSDAPPSESTDPRG